MRGFNDLESVYDTGEFLPLTFYFGAPYSIPEGNARASWYGISGTPNVMIGGIVNHIGGTPSGSMFTTYDPTVASQLGNPSPLVMSSTYTVVADEVHVSVQIDVEQNVSGSNNQVLFFICQEGLHEQSNMVVDMLADEPFNLTSPGETVTITRDFPMNPNWNEPDLRIIVVVQDMGTRVIHQATLSWADYAAQVVIDAEPDGVEAPWTLTGPDLEITKTGDKVINLWQTGTYTITWHDLPVWTPPSGNPEVQTVADDGIITFFGQYTDGPFLTSSAGPIGNTASGQAVSFVDVDGDGDLDIHVANEDAADQLLRNDGSGVFDDIASGPIAEVGPSRGAAWADINGDGFLDAFLARNNETDILMMGNGSGGFTTATMIGHDGILPGSSSSWIDYDLDGALDLYIVNYGEANTLLRNLGGFGETIVFGPQGGDQADSGNGSSACWTDSDLDGRPDLFIANQFDANVFLQNTAIGFSDLTNTSGIGEHLEKALGAAWGDYDNDGDFDLYVANEGMADQLFRCTGPLQYTQIAGDNLDDRGYGRGVAWIDLNNDTFLDLYVVRNGQTDLLLLGDGTGQFVRVPVGPPEADGPGNAVACGDVDDDGDIDVFISREGASNVLFSNEMGDGKRWIKLHLTGLGNNTCAIGARVVLTAGGVSQSRMVTSGSGYLCNNALDLHFGLDATTQVDQIEIFWPDGTHETHGPTFSNQTLNIVQGQNLPSPVEGGLPVRTTALGLAHPNPFNPSTTISFALARADAARLDVFTVDGRHVRTLVDGGLAAGPHTAVWDGTDHQGRSVSSGTYFYRLTTAGGFSDAGRMVLVK